MLKRGFTLIEVVITLSFISLILFVVAYINVRSINNHKDLIYYYTVTDLLNVEEIIKSDFKFYDNINTYYDEDFILKQEAGIYKFIYLYFDNYNQLCEKSMAKFLIKVQYYFINSTRYQLYQYEIRMMEIDQITRTERNIGKSVKFNFYKKK